MGVDSIRNHTPKLISYILGVSELRHVLLTCFLQFDRISNVNKTMKWNYGHK